MKKKQLATTIKKIILGCSLLMMVSVMEGCANMHMSTSVGVGMSFGPYGPSVRPVMNVGVYSGGRW